VNAHKFPECDGRWIDISTLLERKAICGKCRAVVPFVPEEDAEPPMQLPELATEDWQAPRSPVGVWPCIGYLIAAFVCGVVVGLLV
jgi:hypothetical protein